MFGIVERLWPIWVLLIAVAGWRLWHLRARGEGDPESTQEERRRWKRMLIAGGLLLLLSFLAILFGSRPQTGEYHPLQMDRDGSLEPAGIDHP